jgi:predicted transcriptional regulator
MNKVIILSVQPQWLVKILNGEKTIEIRKSIPKCDYPIDVYLYCTNAKPFLMVGRNDNKTYLDNGGKEE